MASLSTRSPAAAARCADVHARVTAQLLSVLPWFSPPAKRRRTSSRSCWTKSPRESSRCGEAAQ